MNSTDKLREYFGPDWSLMIIGGILAAFNIFLIVIFTLKYSSIDCFIVCFHGGMALLCIIFPLIMRTKGKASIEDTFKKLEQKGLLDDAVDDFNKAVSDLNGWVMIGHNYLFLKTGKIILYEEIREVYHVVYPRGIRRSLIMRLENGSKIEISYRFIDNLFQLIQVMRMKNKNIIFEEAIIKMVLDQQRYRFNAF